MNITPSGRRRWLRIVASLLLFTTIYVAANVVLAKALRSRPPIGHDWRLVQIVLSTVIVAVAIVVAYFVERSGGK